MTDPIRMRCEGSGCPPGTELHFEDEDMRIVTGMCAMCGIVHVMAADRLGARVLPEHDRDDVLAMIERGDFG